MGWQTLGLPTQVNADSLAYVSEMDLSNLMVVPAPPGSPFPFVLKHAPGVSTSGITMPAGGASILGACLHAGYLWYVLDSGDVYYFDGTTHTKVPIGTVAAIGYYQMVDAGTHVVMVDGTNAYAATTAQVSACPITGFCAVAYLHGYTVFLKTNSDQMYVSALDNPLSIDALDFTTVDAQSGDLRGVVAHNGELIVFKESSGEIYQNVGGSGFPFQRVAEIERGCASWGTLAKRENEIAWVGDDYRVYKLQGYQPVPISTPRIEQLLSGVAATPGLLRASVYQFDGHTYYAITEFPGVDSTGMLVYDLNAGLWHRHFAFPTWTGGNVINGVTQVVDILNYAPSGQALHAWVAQNASLAKLSTTTYKDTGLTDPNPRLAVFPPVVSGGQRAFMPELFVEQLPHSATSTVDLAWSDNGGVSYTTWGAHPANGQNTRLRWQRLGSFFRRTLKMKVQTNSPIAISGIRARVEVGA